MKQISINGTARTELGKKAAKAIRNSGNVPCVLYGEKKDANGQPEAIHFSVSEKEINKLIYTILKEVQFHPVKDNVLHVDFLEVHAEKPIVMGVPIAPQGLAEGVRAGGRLITMVRKLNVKALYSAIPEKLNIDVTALQLGKSIKVGDLHFENLELVTPKEVIVCTVKMTRAAMGAAAAAAKA